MKFVTPYRKFRPESFQHERLGRFDWIGAMSMLAFSARASNECETYALTDRQTKTGIAAHRYETQSTRLMLWILEVTWRYLSSADFDQDTVFISPDMLVMRPMRGWFGKFDLGLMYREHPKFPCPVLNSVQLFCRKKQGKLADFYAAVFETAQTLPEKSLTWGADTEAIYRAIEPAELGLNRRHGLRVQMIDSKDLTCWPAPPWWRNNVTIASPIVDFKGTRKLRMHEFFALTLGELR